MKLEPWLQSWGEFAQHPMIDGKAYSVYSYRILVVKTVDFGGCTTLTISKFLQEYF